MRAFGDPRSVMRRPGADWRRPDWRLGVVLIWLVACICMLAYKWHAIRWFSLGDTDDNMRFLQVRDWLHGQGWYDLRQHRMNPPGGASIHWTRLVDLPIAVIVLLTRPWIGEHDAWYVAVAAAPLIPLLVAMFAVTVTVRRLVTADAGPLAPLLLLCGQVLLLMFMPLRIDHHNWQLACLSWTMAGIADPKRARGGATVGLSSAASLTIGLELLPYAAMAAGITGLRWVADRDDARRMMALGASLAAGCTVGYLGFASTDNQNLVCDALSPVWLSVAALGGGLLVLLGLLPVRALPLRLLAAAVAGGGLVAFYMLAWPDCVTTHLEKMSPELQTLWFSNVREAKPLYEHPWRVGVPILMLPVAGFVGAVMAAWQNRANRAGIPWASAALFTLFATLMLAWQSRAGPSAQLLAIPGATWLCWTYLPRMLASDRMTVRVFGTVGGFLLFSGLWFFLVETWIPEPAVKPGMRAVNHANALCPTLPALAELEPLAPATIFTFVDLGPRLIAVTHHSVVAGPYHRNGDAILDVHHAFRGPVPLAHKLILQHGAQYVLICPGMSESTIYRVQAPQGFYAALIHNHVPDWLARVPLPRNSPFVMWRVVG